MPRNYRLKKAFCLNLALKQNKTKQTNKQKTLMLQSLYHYIAISLNSNNKANKKGVIY